MNARDVALVFRREVRDLLRDRRAVFAAIVLPVLVYPLLLVGSQRMRAAAARSLASREAAIGFAAGAEALRAEIGERLAALSCRLAPGDALLADLAGGALQALIESDGGKGAVVRFRGGDERSEEAASRVSRAFEERREERRRDLLASLGIAPDPGESLRFQSLDAAPPERAGGSVLGRLLPLLLILLTISAGSFAAIDAFAGERERGTLETLLVHPIAPSDVAAGKYLAILATCLSASALNVAGLGASAVFLRAGEVPLRVSPLALLGAFLLLLPTAALFSALLALVSARARSFREGQNYVLPLSLACMVPGLAAVLPGIEFTPLLAVVPISGPALAIREVLKGSAPLLPLALSIASSTLFAALLVRRVGGLLDAERILREEPPEAEATRAGRHARATLGASAVAFLLVFYLGFPAQARDPIGGLAATLFGIVAPSAYVVSRAARLRLGEAFPLVPLRPALLLAGASLVPGAALLSGHLFSLQQVFLPVPESFLREMQEKLRLDTLSTPVALLLFAVSPGLCEELLFRGAILAGLARDLPARRAILLSSLLFGAFHFSVYRLFPQSVLGALLAVLTLRSGSLWPAVVLHAGHNAIVLYAGEALAARSADPLFLGACAAAAAAGVWLLRCAAPRRP